MKGGTVQGAQTRRFYNGGFGRPSMTQQQRAPNGSRSSAGATSEPALSPERLALAWLHGARFLTTASKLDQLPMSEIPEFAFVGRSNAGKSTAINTLTQQKRLAFASKTPGRTQHINLFELGPREAPDALLADLPGYGYAAVNRTAKERWQQVMADYLAYRRALGGVVLMIDSRLGFTSLDLQLLEFVAPRVITGEVKLLALLTKADKLNRRELQASIDSAQAALEPLATEAADVGLVPFSALKRTGLEDVALALREWVPAVAPAAVGEAPTPPASSAPPEAP